MDEKNKHKEEKNMKVRTGFVSNSSSSSFVCVGINDEELIKQIVAKENIKEVGGYGITEGNNFNHYGGEQFEVDEKNPLQPRYTGIDIEKLLETKTLPELKKMFQAKVKELGIDVPIEEIRLHYGEVSSE